MVQRRRGIWYFGALVLVLVLAIALAFGAERIVELAGRLAGQDNAVEAPASEAEPRAETPEEALLARAFPEPTVWDEEESPAYWRVVGPAVVDLDIPAGEIWYAPLDELGRARRAAGTIDAATMEAGTARERRDMRSLEPSGWGHNAEATLVQPNGNSYHGYFWNRSHLVAKSLGGADELPNLVTGTRMQNVGSNDGQGGMSYPEGLARAWLQEHPEGTLFYSATPLYEGDELLCRSVLVDLRSSDGTLDLEFEVYNAAQGFRIDYATGTFEELG